MRIYQLYAYLFNNPFSPKNYRDLELYYQQKGMHQEASAFDKLIKQRFQNEHNNPHPDRNTEQPGGNSELPIAH
jgi:hypothetical protein